MRRPKAISSRMPGGLELNKDHFPQRFDGLEILRSDFSLRDREVKLSFNVKHKLDHIYGVQSNIDQVTSRINFGRDRVLREDRPDERDNSILNVSITG